MGVRIARGRTRTAPEGADRRRRGDRDSGDRAARASRRLRRHRRQQRRGANGRGEAAMMRFIRSAFVIGRRDFGATVLSKTFIFFLLGPMFPLLFGGVFGSIGARVASQTARPVIAVVPTDWEFGRLSAARDRLASALSDEGVVRLVRFAPEGE